MTTMRAQAIAIATLAIACTRPADDPRPLRATAARVETNVARNDYVGPKACGDCHADEHARWSNSLHRVMNAKANEPGAIIGDFSGATVAYAGGEARFAREAGDYIMTLARGGVAVRYRVTRTIGRRGLQEYVGIESGKTDEVRLPFGWWPRRGGWYPQPYFDPWLDEAKFDPYAPVHEPWAERCPWCHSTYPFELRIERARATKLGHGLEQAVADQPPIAHVGPRERLAIEQQITTGISCESCHLGGRAHAAGAPIHFMPQLAADVVHADNHPVAFRSSDFANERRDPAIINTVCAQCHSGPSPRLADGTALRNSSEAIDLAASPCAGIKCTDCHDPHRADARADEPRAIAACTKCHASLADPKAATSHAGAGHATTTCLDCHMPRIVMGIDHYVRTHRISSPTNATLLAAAAPNACNLCHLDRSIHWTLDALANQWDVHIRVSEKAYGDRNVGDAWLASNTPAFRLIAAHAYARSPLGKLALPQLLRGLDDRLAYVRTWTMFAIEDVLGRKLRADQYDPRAPVEIRTRQLATLKSR